MLNQPLWTLFSIFASVLQFLCPVIGYGPQTSLTLSPLHFESYSIVPARIFQRVHWSCQQPSFFLARPEVAGCFPSIPARPHPTFSAVSIQNHGTSVLASLLSLSLGPLPPLGLDFWSRKRILQQVSQQRRLAPLHPAPTRSVLSSSALELAYFFWHASLPRAPCMAVSSSCISKTCFLGSNSRVLSSSALSWDSSEFLVFSRPALRVLPKVAENFGVFNQSQNVDGHALFDNVSPLLTLWHLRVSLGASARSPSCSV